jgi:uncharacterized Zn-finger protein
MLAAMASPAKRRAGEAAADCSARQARLQAAATQLRIARMEAMAGHAIPHLHNDRGHALIHVGAKEFMCVGALPPFDHPHVFLDMGSDDEIVCPYCSTLFRHRNGLHADQTDPADCVMTDAPAKAA